MAITIKDVEHVAKLARLEFEENEILAFTEKLDAIVGYVEMLNAVDVENVDPTYHVLPVKNRFREDEIQASLERDAVLTNAPDRRGGCFRVPRVVE
ncbi:Asp-tRNA(Asn)/Glu-tRNA(Gln) amidotransferase subunit GatC [Acidaminobacter sp.]|jgi:aspartyl-tRNA(Asn)/glutamyl-tRNA(Gln) amidotransferase subunit C|uniref:Asp-tRNA(Asn)/Glu-tRNA(Gln) amidotransferase subunit GatC n=1 Tax=Acidaminobacter sp. TaxID=1872102 RepID=UPI001384EA4F|nr:Asp-tRNA(Asn)/Glu-tRNA(Gln) amidotransferase subunit GatC [Acidaminobacter sp.]MDK9711345.1 Asp-tRNA(Asn)/Glu-tRNA(Gln) amidotransferase subunit GatC [Acidaminobacter sp.]MZQ97152.1 Asp-tRNA(Asn)/Glu-tRNA(Gln) amidotransferase subunit GatC [Acidaminobacter sp.]